MSEKSSTLLLYALLISILLPVTGFLGITVRLFASAAIADSIFLALFVIVLMTLLLWFVLRRPLPKPALDIRGRLPHASWHG